MPRNYTPLPWPYQAKAARDEAAEQAAAALNNVVPLAEEITDLQHLRRVTKAIFHMQNALRLLESVGAQTKPPTAP